MLVAIAAPSTRVRTEDIFIVFSPFTGVPEGAQAIAGCEAAVPLRGLRPDPPLRPFGKAGRACRLGLAGALATRARRRWPGFLLVAVVFMPACSVLPRLPS